MPNKHKTGIFMDNIDWDKLRIFHAVAEAGSLTHAGDVLNMSQSAVSRQIRALEETLSATLFHRHARGLILTEQGEHLYQATKHMESSLENATAQIRDSKDEALGELRVTTTTGFGALWLAPRLKNLYQNAPELSIDLILSERVLDLPMRQADVAIRMKEPSQADLIRRRLMDVNICFYTTQAFVDQNGIPESVDEIENHRLIAQRPNEVQVSAGAEFLRPFLENPNQDVLYVNSYFGILQTVLVGLGIGALPSYLAAEYPQLIRVLPDLQSVSIPVYLAYPEELRNSKRVNVFRDFILEEISQYRRDAEAALDKDS